MLTGKQRKTNGGRATIFTSLVNDQRGQQNSRGWTVIDQKKFRPFSLPMPQEESKPQSVYVGEIFLVNWRLPPRLGRVRWNSRLLVDRLVLPLNPFPNVYIQMTTDLSNGVAIKGDQMAKGSTVSSDGLTETLKQLPKKSAQESLGLPPGAGLFMPFIAATAGMMLLLILLTAIPYAMDKGRTPTENTSTPAANEKPEQSAPTQATTTPAASSPTTPDVSSKTNPKISVKSDFPDKLGENASKTAKPNVNPLDKKDDDLLKEIK
jgi:hypothetical protein